MQYGTASRRWRHLNTSVDEAVPEAPLRLTDSRTPRPPNPVCPPDLSRTSTVHRAPATGCRLPATRRTWATRSGVTPGPFLLQQPPADGPARHQVTLRVVPRLENPTPPPTVEVRAAGRQHSTAGPSGGGRVRHRRRRVPGVLPMLALGRPARGPDVSRGASAGADSASPTSWSSPTDCPSTWERQADGSPWRRSPGGLVTALEPLLRRNRGAWMGWPGIIDGPEEPIFEEDLNSTTGVVQRPGRRRVLRVSPTPPQWPLYHDVIVKPIYHREWWNRYVDVNRRFAEATAGAAPRGDRMGPGLPVAAGPEDAANPATGPHHRFLPAHPVPAGRTVHADARRTEIIDGLLGPTWSASHLPGAPRIFCSCPVDLAGAEDHPRRGGRPVTRRGPPRRRENSQVGAFPISTDSADLDRARNRDIGAARQIRTELGSPRKLLPGSGSPDYTKGTTSGQGLLRVARRGPGPGRRHRCSSSWPRPAANGWTATGSCATTSRQQVGHINGEYAEVGHPVVHYLHRPVPATS